MTCPTLNYLTENSRAYWKHYKFMMCGVKNDCLPQRIENVLELIVQLNILFTIEWLGLQLGKKFVKSVWPFCSILHACIIGIEVLEIQSYKVKCIL